MKIFSDKHCVASARNKAEPEFDALRVERETSRFDLK
jgi:hypothetical protein